MPIQDWRVLDRCPFGFGLGFVGWTRCRPFGEEWTVEGGGWRYLELGKTCFVPMFLVIIHTPLHSGNCDLNTK